MGKTVKENERGRRKRTERARKWREWALMMRFDSERIAQRFSDGDGDCEVAMVDEEQRNYQDDVDDGRVEKWEMGLFCLFVSGRKGRPL